MCDLLAAPSIYKCSVNCHCLNLFIAHRYISLLDILLLDVCLGLHSYTSITLWLCFIQQNRFMSIANNTINSFHIRRRFSLNKHVRTAHMIPNSPEISEPEALYRLCSHFSLKWLKSLYKGVLSFDVIFSAYCSFVCIVLRALTGIYTYPRRMLGLRTEDISTNSPFLSSFPLTILLPASHPPQNSARKLRERYELYQWVLLH